MASFVTVPSFIVAFNSRFPLKTYPPIKPLEKTKLTAPTLWIQPPRSLAELPDNRLSRDVECLKWQAYLALRGVKGIKVRWDIFPEGCIDESLPNLHVPISESLLKSENMKLSEGEDEGQLLPAHSIPTWVNKTLGIDSGADPLKGYKDEEARIESRAWVSLLEGIIHAALIIAQPHPSYLHSILFPQSTPPLSESLQKILSPHPPPLTGLYAFLPPTGVRINTTSILSQYREAIASLSQRLGTDKWLLGSSDPTPLDALAFAYLHCILHSSEAIRIEVTRRVNLVAWEWRVRCLVRDGFAR